MGSAPLLQVGGARCVDAVLLLLPTQLLGLLAAGCDYLLSGAGVYDYCRCVCVVMSH